MEFNCKNGLEFLLRQGLLNYMSVSVRDWKSPRESGAYKSSRLSF